MDVLVLNKGLRYEGCQPISNAVGGRIQNSRDFIFTALGFDFLQSGYVAHTDDQKRERELRL